MAKRSENHKLGDLGEQKVRLVFAEAGFAVSEISPDYGEGFFVFGEDKGVIEPFKIYVQVKASGKEDKYISDWTIYEDCLTVRNWIMENSLTVIIRYNERSGVYKYCIPEDEIEYWEIPFSEGGNVAIKCSENFDIDAARKLMWIARIRHYDRVVKITQPNEIDANVWDGMPKYQLFCFELLVRLKLIDSCDLRLRDEVYAKLLSMSEWLVEEYEDSDDMSAKDKSIYASCSLLIINRLEDISGCKIGMTRYLLDSCACLVFKCFKNGEEKGSG